MFSTTITSFAIATILAMNGVMAALPTSCTAPVTPTDSTYGLCAYPLTDAAAASPQAVVDYMNNHAGCNSVAGGSAVPAGVITGRKCGGPGPEIITDGVPGWAIDSVFNPAACPPGSKCLKFKA